MAFPDDYQRVGNAGGPNDLIMVHVGVPRQLLVNETTKTVHIMDGQTPGGFPLVAVADFVRIFKTMAKGSYQAVGLPLGTEEVASDAPMTWSVAVMRALFETGFTIGPNGWILNDNATPARLQKYLTDRNDLNAVTETGFTTVNPAFASNLPAGIPTATASRLMLFTMSQSASNAIQTLYIRDGSNKVWSRNLLNGEWKDWVLITGLTQDDLDTRVKKAGDTNVGKLTFKASSAGAAQLNLPAGLLPDNPVNGDVWNQAGDLYLLRDNSPVKLYSRADAASADQIRTGGEGKFVAPTQLREAIADIMFGKYVSLATTRLRNTTYRNNTTRWMIVIVGCSADGVELEYSATGTGFSIIAGDPQARKAMGLIPPGAYYRMQAPSGAILWFESTGA